ncbi:MAG: lysophospholipase [Candidatus Obscuribacterales bacterium]|jgi:alpha-beta hydrolase superfamily lysophospholipase|nr:lysophospholipase [Candidatus Obscuribacterales bacterium]
MVKLALRRVLSRCALALSLIATALPATATEIECQYHTDLEYLLNMPIYHWAPTGPAKGVILALHGLVMHGQSYDELGKTLAEKGFLVYATDMRGYGRLTKDYPHEFCSAKDCKQKIHYGKSSEDLIKLADKLKSDHPDLPLYVVGESMGADMAIRIASARPNLADGLVLSSPAIRAHHFVDSTTVKNVPAIMANFRRQLDLMPYVKKYASEDPEIVAELTKDPMLRRKMSTTELLLSRASINQTLAYVPNLSPNKPVLVLQAKDDRCVRADAVVLLMSRLKSQDQQVRWFENRGHILIETSHIRPDTMETIVSWLDTHNVSKTAAEMQSGKELLTSGGEQDPAGPRNE